MSIKKSYIEFKNALTKFETENATKHFEEAFNQAFEMFNEKLKNNEKFNLDNEEEKFALLTLFDNMIGFYKEKMFEDGLKYAYTLAEMVDNPKLKEMFIGFALGMEKGIILEDFLREYVDLSKVDKDFPEFLCNFKEKIKELV
jgi:predicted nucleic acid-binding protein